MPLTSTAPLDAYFADRSLSKLRYASKMFTQDDDYEVPSGSMIDREIMDLLNGTGEGEPKGIIDASMIEPKQ